MKATEIVYLGGGWLLLTVFGIALGKGIVMMLEARACPPCEECTPSPQCDVYSVPPVVPGYAYYR